MFNYMEYTSFSAAVECLKVELRWLDSLDLVAELLSHARFGKPIHGIVFKYIPVDARCVKCGTYWRNKKPERWDIKQSTVADCDKEKSK